MTVDYISNGKPERIPPIGTQFQLKEHLYFKVEAYGPSEEIDYPDSPTGKAYKLQLLGCYVIPKGSPIEVLEQFWGVE